jgi:hypothetical protein
VPFQENGNSHHCLGLLVALLCSALASCSAVLLVFLRESASPPGLLACRQLVRCERQGHSYHAVTCDKLCQRLLTPPIGTGGAHRQDKVPEQDDINNDSTDDSLLSEKAV